MTSSLRKAMRSTGYYIISTNPKHHEDTAKLYFLRTNIVQLKHMQNSVKKKKQTNNKTKHKQTTDVKNIGHDEFETSSSHLE